MLVTRAHTTVGVFLVIAGLLIPATSHGRKPRLQLEQLDHSRCASDGVVTAWVAELELEGEMRAPTVGGFRLKVDGKQLPDAPVKAIKFAASTRPLRLALVIQSSEAYSMDLKSIKAGATALVRALPERGQVAIIQYAAEARRKVAFGPRQKALEALAELEASELSGDVALVPAVKMGLRGLATGPRARRLLVVLSDGLNESPKRDVFRALGDKAHKAGIPIHPIAFSPVDERGPLLNLGEIAKRSAGTLRWARRPGTLVEQFQNLGSEINDQLGLTFKVPDRCLAPHKVGVTSGRLRSRVVQLPRMKPVKQTSSTRSGAAAGGGKQGRGKYTWVAIPVGGVLLLVSALVIWLMARRWMTHQKVAAAPAPVAPPSQKPPGEAPLESGPGSQQTDSRVTGARPIQAQISHPGLQVNEPRPSPPDLAPGPGLQATGPMPVAVQPVAVELQATGPRQIPFDELPTISPGDTVNPQQPIAAMARQSMALIGCAPPLQGWRADLPQGESYIGTAPDCLICLDPSLGVSTYHVRLQLQVGRLTAEDLESRSGLFVNRQRVGQATLSDGDVVQVGQAIFQVKNG